MIENLFIFLIFKKNSKIIILLIYILFLFMKLIQLKSHL